MSEKITFALPSKGAISEPTLSFLRDCGLRVEKPNDRQYTGLIAGLPAVNVLFQRVKDVLYKVADGTAQLGITGYDVVREFPHDDLVVIHPGLGYGHCSLVIAVPESWVDVDQVDDLMDVAQDMREHQQRNLRVATTYPHLTRQFLHARGIHHFNIVKAEGAIEVAPTIGYADVIVDLTQTGTTLRENHLKQLTDGTIIDSQAVLVGNRRALEQNPGLLDTLRAMLEYIDAALYGRRYAQVTVNICGSGAEEIGRKVVANPATAGLLGPTIAPIYSPRGSEDDRRWHTVTITVENKHLMQAVEYLRSIGGTQIITTPVRYIFLEQSPTFEALLKVLNLQGQG
jgi:ATP phosphoribosyltransferase